MRMKHNKNEEVMTYLITEVAQSTIKQRKKRYLQLMALRVILVPGVFLLDLPVAIQAGIIMVAALSQFAAVIGANTPDQRANGNPNNIQPRLPALPTITSFDKVDSVDSKRKKENYVSF